MMIPDNNTLAVFYDAVAQDAQRKRYRDLVREYSNRFGNPDTLRFFSAPGRTELGGNHTDHNHGKVLCAAVGCDIVAAVEARTDKRVQLKSSVFPQLFEIDLTRLDFKEEEKGTTDALIRGVAAGAKEKGFSVGGFNAVV
jgi:galactokinase